MRISFCRSSRDSSVRKARRRRRWSWTNNKYVRAHYIISRAVQARFRRGERSTADTGNIKWILARLMSWKFVKGVRRYGQRKRTLSGPPYQPLNGWVWLMVGRRGGFVQRRPVSLISPRR